MKFHPEKYLANIHITYNNAVNKKGRFPQSVIFLNGGTNNSKFDVWYIAALEETQVRAADIEKMYSQIRVDPQDAYLQRIVWRPEPSDPIKQYRFTPFRLSAHRDGLLKLKKFHHHRQVHASEGICLLTTY